MPYAALLTEEEIAGGLAAIPLWRRDGGSIMRSIRCPSFPDAIALVNRVADAAEGSNHHPDIDVRWRTVTFTLSTHASGGLTAKDFEMAATIDRLAEHG